MIDYRTNLTLKGGDLRESCYESTNTLDKSF